MKLHFPNDMRLTLRGIIRRRESGLMLEMPDIDFEGNRPITRDFPVMGYDDATQAQIQAHVDQETTLWGIWHAEGVQGGEDELPNAGFLQVTAVRQQVDELP